MRRLLFLVLLALSTAPSAQHCPWDNYASVVGDWEDFLFGPDTTVDLRRTHPSTRVLTIREHGSDHVEEVSIDTFIDMVVTASEHAEVRQARTDLLMRSMVDHGLVQIDRWVFVAPRPYRYYEDGTLTRCGTYLITVATIGGLARVTRIVDNRQALFVCGR